MRRKERFGWQAYEVIAMPVPIGWSLYLMKDLSDTCERFLKVAKRWQDYHFRDARSAVKKLKEEIEEFEETEEGTLLEELDEAGDILTIAFRLIHSLPADELEFALRVSEMKADRRLPNGKKDKAAEKEEMYRIANSIPDWSVWEYKNGSISRFEEDV